ncbi:hypothetical protein NMG60_11032943 [Bertholletia excelsa]
MAPVVTVKCRLFYGALIYLFVFSCKFAMADEGFPQTGVGTEDPAHEYPTPDDPTHEYPTHGDPTHEDPVHEDPTHEYPTHEDPSQIIAKALICFHDKYIYSSCDQAYRLTEKGDLNVPPEYTDHFCNGPCLEETKLVLHCIEGITSHFKFYSHATVKDVRETIKAGCGYGLQRGNFNVAEHIQAEEEAANRITFPAIVGLVLGILAQGLFI